jgi:murein L,D-transpeptidase YafK
LGRMPNGPKQREGDFRTPEGKYFLDGRNTDSDFFLSIHVSYPNDADRARARVEGVDPGGQIMIHGWPNDPKYDLQRYENTDWTDGCIAVNNSDMIDIWLMTRESTPIEIRP